MTAPQAVLSGSRPNVVLILADDLGFSDIGAFGGEIDTPHLDALARDGLLLTQMYNCARCCPSRASLMTGVHPHQAGIGHMTLDMGHPSYLGRLRTDRPTIAEMLAGRGYATSMVGKWHLGGEYPLQSSLDTWRRLRDSGYPTPRQRGFDSFFGTLTGAGSYFEPVTLMEGDRFIDRNEIDQDFYYTDEIGKRAVETIRAAAGTGTPFFLYVAHVAPHWPLHAFEDDVARFRKRYRVGWDVIRSERRDRLVEAGILDSGWPVSVRDPYAPAWSDTPNQLWEAERMAVYAAQVHAMDRTIGDLIEELETQGIRDDTLVIFMSDNGGCSELLREDEFIEPPMSRTRRGDPVRTGNSPEIMPGPETTFMSYGLPWANTSNSPFRLFKHWVHEGGIASPCIISWPNGAQAGMRHEVTHVVDLAATLCDLAGNPDAAPTPELEGQSIAPLFGDGLFERPTPVGWEHEGNRALRTDDWKLVARVGLPWELYNMRDDRTEQSDVSSRHPDVVEELARLWREWAERVGVVDFDVVREWIAQRRVVRLYGWVERGRPEQ